MKMPAILGPAVANVTVLPACAVGLFGVSRADAVVLVADYQFNNNLSSSVAGALDLVHPGTGGSGGGAAGAFQTGVTVGAGTRTVFNTTAASGFSLDVSTILAGYTRDYTVAILFNAPLTGSYSSLFDASHGTSDNNTNRYDNNLKFFYGADTQIGTLPANLWDQAIISVTADGASNVDLLGATEIGGGQVIGTKSNVNSAGFAIGAANTLNFFRDNGGDTFPAGSVARIQVYAGAITDTPTLNALDLTAFAEVPEPASLGSIALGSIALLVRKRS